jgi:hypothetical protein
LTTSLTANEPPSVTLVDVSVKSVVPSDCTARFVRVTVAAPLDFWARPFAVTPLRLKPFASLIVMMGLFGSTVTV